VFTAELGEAVICADEEVVAAYVVIVVKRRPVGRHRLGIVVPLKLDSMRLALPGKDGAVMDLGLIKLGGGSGKDGFDFALVEALAVSMEEGYVADAGPAVLD